MNRSSRGSREVDGLLYYYPNLKSLDDVRSLMVEYVMQDGSFLLRNSISKPGILTVTVMHSYSIKHFNLGVKNDMYFLQNQYFESVQQLIDFYKVHDVPNEEGVRHLRLLHPINRSRPAAPRQRDSVPLPPTPSLITTRSMSVVTMPSMPQTHVDPRRQSLDNHSSHSSQNGQWNGNGAYGGETPAGSFTNEPALPISQPKKEKKSIIPNIFGRRKKTNSGSESLTSGSESHASSPQDRLPAPLPPQAFQAPNTRESPYYSVISTDQIDRTEDLIYHIRKFEQTGDERCECGLTIEESELPDGWSMHISREPNTDGRLFYMGPNDETEWNLPMNVLLNLTVEQQDTIKRLMSPNGQVLPTVLSGSSGSGSTGGIRSTSSTTSLRSDQSRSVTRQATEHECNSGNDEVFQM